MDSYPTSPESDPVPESRPSAPDSVRTAVKLIWATVAMSVISAILTFLFRRELLDSAMTAPGSADNRAAEQVFLIIGAVFGLLISVGLAVLFAYFISKGAKWARIVYTVILVLSILLNFSGLFGSQPVGILVATVVGLLLSVAILFFLYRPDSNAYFAS